MSIWSTLIPAEAPPTSCNENITRFLSLFLKAHEFLCVVSYFLRSLTPSAAFFFFLFVQCLFSTSCFFLKRQYPVGILCLARPSPATLRARSVSESESSFGLPSSFSAPTFLKSIYQGSLGQLADSGNHKR